eukprot:Skav217134  [mRNA]  locus=scaffold1539:7550:12588:- [translate_table: standard]
MGVQVEAPKEETKPKEAPHYSKHEVKVWRAVEKSEPPKWEEKKYEKPHERKSEKWWKDSWKDRWKDTESTLADLAIKEITAQVMVPEAKGFVWVDDWQDERWMLPNCGGTFVGGIPGVETG